jgi:hypothetical protein
VEAAAQQKAAPGETASGGLKPPCDRPYGSRCQRPDIADEVRRKRGLSELETALAMLGVAVADAEGARAKLLEA